MIHYAQDLILEQVNTFFGYKAISKLQMSHGFIPPKVGVEKSLPFLLSQEEKEWLESQMGSITDPELKDHLERLGEAICEVA